MVRIKAAEEIRKLIKTLPLEQRRIFSIVAHIDHGKSTMCDYLLARAGMLSFDLAGQRRLTDYDEEEQRRIITIFTTVVNLLYEYNGKPYLLTLNDTPGHISFTGEVSRAIRASDGVILLVDAAEGIMTQTETNLYLSLLERCKPVLYINKADRLIREFKCTPREFVARIDQIIRGINKLIEKYAPDEKTRKEWKVSFIKGTVAVGSAKDGWGFTIKTLMKRFGSDPKEAVQKGIKRIFELYEAGDIETLKKEFPLDEAILEMVIEHLPDPKTAQPYKIQAIWQGDKDIDAYKAMLNVDQNGPLVGMITKIFIHPKTFRPVLIGRIWSGTLKVGKPLYLLSARREAVPRRIGVMEITDILDVDAIPAGNMFAMAGFIVPAGEAFIEKDAAEKYMSLIEEGRFGFEPIPYASEPVVTRVIRPKNPGDIDKLAQVAQLWTSADPTARFFIDRESNTYVLMGVDPLQIEILTKRIAMKVPINVEPPIIVYRERVTKRGEEVWTKSPNALNKLCLYVEPLEEEIAEAIKKGIIRADQDPKERARILHKRFGWPADIARKVIDVWETNILINATVGVQYFDRVKDYIIATFRKFCNEGPLAKEPVQNLKVVLVDAKIHEDPAHTTFAQIFTMTWAGLAVSFLTADPTLYEPITRVDIKVPTQFMGAVMSLLQKKRGRILETEMVEDLVHIIAAVPTAETIDLANELRSVSQGLSLIHI